ncbi:GtrA family protein [Streptomyces sp. RB6PN25]|uniref:GtrA family protein n=1 Tax=Streptomyces humicola TaxID=2953240 RepID=A0ABT1Q5A4_9ACTN|nr:GtrA family protein [Streptomyces humicola]MCQ4085106.1 GtrA family protein [Streptomyces humicola]
MSRLSALNTRVKLLYREVAKFGLVGIAGIFVNMIALNLLLSTGLQTVRASVIATIIAIAFNYVGFRYFTYRNADRSQRGKEIGLFVFFSVVGLVIQNGILYAATYGMGWDGRLANNFWSLTGIGVATLFRFWSYRTWVFRSLPAKAVEQAEAFLTESEQQARAGARK